VKVPPPEPVKSRTAPSTSIGAPVPEIAVERCLNMPPAEIVTVPSFVNVPPSS
jgi:hypothetical protein